MESQASDPNLDALRLAAAGGDPVVGREVGPWTIECPLGSGGFGSVYLARHRESGEPVAIKIFTRVDVSGSAYERFQRGCRVAAQLTHPNIVRILGGGSVDARPYIAMSYVDGGALDARIPCAPDGNRSGCDLTDARRWVGSLVSALGYLHERGILHRDLKPSNVLCASTGEISLADFDLAREADDGEARLTQTGTGVGTVAYVSPEQLRGEEVDPRTDIYSLGAVWYELASGIPPHGQLPSVEMAVAVLSARPLDVRERRPEVPRREAELIMRMLARDRDDRPTLVEIAEHLASPPRAAPARSSRRLPKATRPAPAPAPPHLLATPAAIPVLAAALVLVAAVAFALGRSTHRDARPEVGSLTGADVEVAPPAATPGKSDEVTAPPEREVASDPPGDHDEIADPPETSPGSVVRGDASVEPPPDAPSPPPPVAPPGRQPDPDAEREAARARAGKRPPTPAEEEAMAAGLRAMIRKALPRTVGDARAILTKADAEAVAPDGPFDLERRRWRVAIADLEAIVAHAKAAMRREPRAFPFGFGSISADGKISEQYHLERVEGEVCIMRAEHPRPDGTRPRQEHPIDGVFSRMTSYWLEKWYDVGPAKDPTERLRHRASIWLVIPHHSHPEIFPRDWRPLVRQAIDAGQLAHLRPEAEALGLEGGVETAFVVPSAPPGDGSDEAADAAGAAPSAPPGFDPERHGDLRVPATPQEPVAMPDGVGAVTALAWWGRHLASGHADGHVVVWSVSSKGRLRPRRVLDEPHPGPVTAIAPIEGERFVTGSDRGDLRIWSAGTRRPRRTIPASTKAITALAVSPDGERIAAACGVEQVRIWPVRGEEATTIAASTDAGASAVSWSPDGRRIVVGYQDGLVRVFDAETSTLVRGTKRKARPVHLVAHDRDGLRVVVREAKGILVPEGTTTPLRMLVAPGAKPIRGVAWSPDGGVLAISSEDGAVRLWAPKDGALLATVAGMGTVVAFDPKGEALAVAGADGSIRLLRVD